MPPVELPSPVLLLQPGDPLPALAGVEFVAARPRWLLLAVAPATLADGLLAQLRQAQAPGGGLQAEIQLLVHGATTSTPAMVADATGGLARRLGALPASGELQPLAVLIEPRGSVFVACTGTDFKAAALAALAALPSA